MARAETRKELEDYLERETVPAYTCQHGFRKTHRQGGPLEWYCSPDKDGMALADAPAIFDVGTLDEWLQRSERRTRAEWKKAQEEIPTVPTNLIGLQ
jgi:hypothetical protein